LTDGVAAVLIRGASVHVAGPAWRLDRPARLAGSTTEESTAVADYTPYQRKIIDRYYKNFDAIKFQRLSELATDLYLAEGKKLDRLWVQVESALRKLEVSEPRIAELTRRRDPAMLVTMLKEIERGS
jgi:hypothetical protein